MFKVVAIPKRSSLNPNPQPQYAYHREKPEAHKIAKEQRSRGIWQSVKVVKEVSND